MSTEDTVGASVAAAVVPAKPKRKRRTAAGLVREQIAEVNRKHALVRMGDKLLVACENLAADGSVVDVDFMSPAAFQLWYAKRKVWIGRQQPVGLGELWLQHEDRRDYRGIVFRPQGAEPDLYNLYRGFSVTPKPGNWKTAYPTLRDHLFTNICAGNEQLYLWVFGWFAHLFQRPAERLGTAMALRGKEGTGKTKIGEIMGSLIKAHYLLVSSPRYLTGQFNSHQATNLLLQTDEGFWAGDKQAEGVLKSLITSSRHMIERKGVDAVFVDNYVRLLVTSNEEWVVPAGLEARRFAIFDVGDAAIQNADYFRQIDAEMDAGGREVLLADLLAFDLGQVNLREVPNTQALVEQKLFSMRPEVDWWRERLLEGSIAPNAGEWTEAQPILERVYRSYIGFAERMGLKRKLSPEQLSLTMKKLLPWAPKITKPSVDIYDERTGQYVNRRARCYVFPELELCRRHLDEVMRTETAWEIPDG